MPNLSVGIRNSKAFGKTENVAKPINGLCDVLVNEAGNDGTAWSRPIHENRLLQAEPSYLIVIMVALLCCPAAAMTRGYVPAAMFGTFRLTWVKPMNCG